VPFVYSCPIRGRPPPGASLRRQCDRSGSPTTLTPPRTAAKHLSALSCHCQRTSETVIASAPARLSLRAQRSNLLRRYRNLRPGPVLRLLRRTRRSSQCHSCIRALFVDGPHPAPHCGVIRSAAKQRSQAAELLPSSPYAAAAAISSPVWRWLPWADRFSLAMTPTEKCTL